MTALATLVAGLAVAHVAWLLCFLTGSVVWNAPADRAAPAHARAVLEVCVISACGIAVIGFGAFAFGIAGLLYPASFAALLIAVGVAAALTGRTPLARAFWMDRLALLRAALSPATAVLYVAAVGLAIGAVLPDNGSDATEYYLAYAFDWATAHRIYTDIWLRFPYYANNWVLLDTWMYELGLQRFIQFLGWICTPLSLFGVYGFVLSLTERYRAAGNEARSARVLTATIAPFSLVLSPAFLHWSPIGMVDIPSGLFFLVIVICGTGAAIDARVSMRALIVCGAFMAGMKSSLVPLLALAGLGIIVTGASLALSRRRIAAMLAILVLLAAPWYVRNFILAADPFAPVLNLRFQGADSINTVADEQLIEGSIREPRSAAALVKIPADIVLHTSDSSYREPGVTWLSLFVELPAAFVIYAFVRRRFESRLALVAAFVLYAVGVWVFVGYFARYALLFDPALAALVAAAVVGLAARLPVPAWTAAVAVAMLAIPSPGSASYLATYWREYYVDPWTAYHGQAAWLDRYPETGAISYVGTYLHDRNFGGVRIYRPHLEEWTIFFKEAGLQPIGDWIGPGRYSEFTDAMTDDALGPYLDRLEIGALLIQTPARALQFFGNSDSWDADQAAMLERELTRLHFRHVDVPGGNYVLYYRRTASGRS